ncbi:hypothetical protein ASPWEDRAFT_198249 [Aspergillus wentii DTO 134E9]|uniref:Uncharacterized protein n=1 Tax=Aspergillus wentii DTO 134E9 TaxID=1073089 RepID=A0A1L9RZI3_ASPWE|nr:uncharacterized protein ASPWEDRAFT_198249 [Aspergillus wentii DTO 134E9]OJJ40284.1 hypothetical protein ASPWEDRAFT_198249 [Aspergillus wentii DTO 134E9]
MKGVRIDRILQASLNYLAININTILFRLLFPQSQCWHHRLALPPLWAVTGWDLQSSRTDFIAQSNSSTDLHSWPTCSALLLPDQPPFQVSPVFRRPDLLARSLGSEVTVPRRVFLLPLQLHRRHRQLVLEGCPLSFFFDSFVLSTTAVCPIVDLVFIVSIGIC